jgi:hypothetical protein
VIRLLAALAAVLAVLVTSPGEAHRVAASGGPPPDGIAIPSLTHGQMAVIADNLSAIQALAGAQIGSDMTTWRLRDYLSLQSFACFWGLVPGSITDEASPFNECSHAYLAAARALLLHLRATPRADREAIDALISKIEAEMLVNGASLTLCRFSDEPFNTNEIVFPRWSEAPTHPPTLAFAAVVLAAIGGAAWTAWPRKGVRRREPEQAEA